MFDNVSVDIETAGKSKRAAIVSIGAVKFSPLSGGVGSNFYTTVRLDSCLAVGLEQDSSTMRWWDDRPASAREVLNCPAALPLEEALKAFAAFIGEDCEGLWGNGPSFDNAILSEAYRLTGIPMPVPYWKDRCVRTVISIARALGTDPKKLIEPNPNSHHALSDAIFQAQLVCKSYEIIACKP